MYSQKIERQYSLRGGGGLLPGRDAPSGLLQDKDNPEYASAVKNQTFLKTGHVLVVDDDPMILNMVGKLFTKMGCQVHHACDGREALAKFEQTPVELVVTDFEMPRMNGWLLGKRIKSWEPAAKVVVMTGLSRESMADYLGDNLIDGWLFKPFKLSEIQTVLDRKSVV